MKEIEDSIGGCLKFRPKTDYDYGWIRINGEKGIGCIATIGFQGGGEQYVNIEVPVCIRDALQRNICS